MTAAPGLSIALPEEAGMSAVGLDRLGAALQARIDSGHIPGAVALIGRRGWIGYLRAFGRRDRGAPDPMIEDAIFRICSMTKPIVPVLATTLWEEERFPHSDPVTKYISAFADAPSRSHLRILSTEPGRPVWARRGASWAGATRKAFMVSIHYNLCVNDKPRRYRRPWAGGGCRGSLIRSTRNLPGPF